MRSFDGMMVPEDYWHQAQAERDEARAMLDVLRGEVERRNGWLRTFIAAWASPITITRAAALGAIEALEGNESSPYYYGALRDAKEAIAELGAMGDVIPPSPDEITATHFTLGDPNDPIGITVEYRDADRWAVTRVGTCLNHDGEWEYEPSPSNRDDDFKARCRFSLSEAFAAARGVVLPLPPETT